MMKSIKMLGLAVVAALALTAIAGSASASATTYSATVLCSENVTECPSASVYGNGTSIEAKLKSGSSFKIANEGILGNQTCSGSTMSAKTTLREGNPLPVEITGWTLSGCGNCTTAEASPFLPYFPYSASVEKSGAGNGSGSIGGGGKGEPWFKFSSCPFGAKCVYRASSIPFTVEGGNPGNLVIKEAPVTRDSEASSSICPETGKLSATYELTSPKPAYVTSSVPREINKIVLCGKLEEPCPSGSIMSAKQPLQATLSSFSVQSGPLITYSCTSGSLSGETLATYGEPSLPVKIASGTLGECNFCGSHALVKTPFEGGITGVGGGDGVLTTYFAMKEFSCSDFHGGWYECELGANVEFNVHGGNLATLETVGWQELKKLSGPSQCGTAKTFKATYSVTQPKGLWVTESS